MISYSTSPRRKPNQAELDWLEAHKKEDFAGSLYLQYVKYGNLTEKQLACIQQKLQPKPEPKSTMVAGIGVAQMEAAFSKAKSNGLKRIGMYIGEYHFKPARGNTPNAGAIFVTNNKDLYLGKIKDGKFTATANCKPNNLESILMICSDPLQFAKAHGINTGICSCCGRELTDPISIADGIGPVCKQKYFG